MLVATPVLVLNLTSVDAEDLNWLRWFGKEENDAFIEDHDNELGMQLAEAFADTLQDADLGLRFYGLTAGLTYSYRIWPNHDDWEGEPVEGTFTADARGASVVTWIDPNVYQLRYGNEEDGWTEWEDSAILFEAVGETKLAVGVGTGVDVELRPRAMLSATVPAYFATLFEEHLVIDLVWPRWRYQLRLPNEGWRPVRDIDARYLELSSREAEFLCLSETGCDESGEALRRPVGPPQSCEFRGDS